MRLPDTNFREYVLCELLRPRVNKAIRRAGVCSEGSRYHPTRADIPTYVNSAHAPKSTTPATHNTNNTTGTGNSRNPSKASPIPVDPGAVVLGSVLGFMVGCLVAMLHTSPLAEEALQGVRASRQVVSGVAGPDLEGGQVAALRLHAAARPRNKCIILPV